jgi:flagellar biosynthesis protein
MNEQDKALGLKYNTVSDGAPKILIKGIGSFAKAIVAKAKEEGVSIIEDKDLAEVLFNFPEGEEIPYELYSAVANIYVMLYKAHSAYKKNEASDF